MLIFNCSIENWEMSGNFCLEFYRQLWECHLVKNFYIRNRIRFRFHDFILQSRELDNQLTILSLISWEWKLYLIHPRLFYLRLSVPVGRNDFALFAALGIPLIRAGRNSSRVAVSTYLSIILYTVSRSIS